jgi:hypothetical protein
MLALEVLRGAQTILGLAVAGRVDLEGVTGHPLMMTSSANKHRSPVDEGHDNLDRMVAAAGAPATAQRSSSDFTLRPDIASRGKRTEREPHQEQVGSDEQSSARGPT